MTKDELEILTIALNFADELLSEVQSSCDWDEESILNKIGYGDNKEDLKFYREMVSNLAEARGIVYRLKDT